MSWDLHAGDGLLGMQALGPASVDHVITDPPYSEHTHAKQRSGAAFAACHSRARELGFACLDRASLEQAAAHFARVTRRWILVFCDEFQSASWRLATHPSG